MNDTPDQLPRPAWAYRFMLRHEGLLSFLMFGVFFLGLGSVMGIVLLVVVVMVALEGRWFLAAQVVAATLFMPGLMVAIGVRWLLQEREMRRAERDPGSSD